MKSNIIHIGANKTASTTLQRALFNQHSELTYMGEDAYEYGDYRDICNSMVNDDDLFYSEDTCKEFFLKYSELESNKNFVYSNEDLLTSRIPAIAAQRLKSLIPDAKIVIVLRNQYTAIPSFYASHGSFLKPAPPSYFHRHVSFDDWMDYNVMFPKYGGVAGYYYNRILNVYSNLYGRDNIHILLFEDFINDKKRFIKKLSNILSINYSESMRLLNGAHERPRVTSRYYNYNKFRTNFMWSKHLTKNIPFGRSISSRFENYLKRGHPVKIELNSSQRKKIFDLYCDDNKALVEKYGVPLQEYGYPI
jgi:hypothetical protein